MFASNSQLHEVVIPIINHVKLCLINKVLLAHLHPTLPKIIQLVAGNSIFTAVLYQQPKSSKRKVIEYLSNVWPSRVRFYTVEKRYALTTREIVERLRPFIQLSESIVIVTFSVAFTILTKNIDF